MDAEVKPPIFVVTKQEVLQFRSTAEAASYMEAVDVRNGEYKAVYDGNGRSLRIVISKRPIFAWAPWMGSVEAVSVVLDDGGSPS